MSLSRSRLIPVILISAIMAGLIAWYSTRITAQPVVAPVLEAVASRSVLFAARSLDPDVVVTDRDYRSRNVAVPQISAEMLEDTPQNRASLAGIVVARYIPEGTPFVTRDLDPRPVPAPPEPVATDTRPAQVADMLRPGMRAIALPVSADTAVAGLITRGDRVDVLTTYQLSDGQQAARIVITNVRVIATDRTLEPSGELPKDAPRTVTLELHSEGVKMLALAMQTGSILLVLSPQDDDGMPEVAEDTPMLASRITALEGIVSPARPQQVQVFRGSSQRVEVMRPERERSPQSAVATDGEPVLPAAAPLAQKP